MRLTLEIKQKCSFFWLRAIRNVNINKCCAKCFIGEKFNEVFEKTLYKNGVTVEIELAPSDAYRAYYLCGLSLGFKYDNNTHVAFVPRAGHTVNLENERISLSITDARQIFFEDYIPKLEGSFSQEQRGCRNWIFANYIKDGMPL